MTYGYDGHGSVRFLTDVNGNVTDTLDYDAFGILVDRTGSTPLNYMYAGEQWDNDLGMYYNRARYLNVNTGRFWSMDDYEGDSEDPHSLHKYLYANDDPANNVDPSGNAGIATASDALSAAFIRAGQSVAATGLLYHHYKQSTLTTYDESRNEQCLQGGGIPLFRTMERERHNPFHYDDPTLTPSLPSLSGLYARKGIDIKPDKKTNLVKPDTGGLSVAPFNPNNLFPAHKPIALGGTSTGSLYCLNSAYIEIIGIRLKYRPDPKKPEKHGLIEPSIEMPFDDYLSFLELTRSYWILLVRGAN